MSIFRAKYHHILNEIKSKGFVLTERTIPFFGGTIEILYVKQLIDTTALSEQIVKPLVHYCSSIKAVLKAQHIMESVIYANDCHVEKEDSKIEGNILNGMAVILFSNDQNYIVANLKKIEHRAIPIPEITYTIRGPRDCLTENLDTNLTLIRYRLKDPNLKIDTFEVGKRTKTSVAVIYMQDIANDTAVKEIEKRIGQIDTDVMWGTGELQAFLLNSKHDLFPQMGTTERSDWACEAIVEGKVLILADGGQIGLIAPHTFGESLIACDDRYDNKFFGLFSRIIRWTALFIALCSTSIYIALVSFHTDVLPANYAIFLAQMRSKVLFSALIEVLIVEFIGELLRESLLRVPSKIGTAIGIVGAIVIGQAATAAGIFSPLLLIIVATSLMASFAIPDYFAAHPIRILKFFMIILTGFLGFYGFVLGLTLILTNLVSINSFGVPYMAPLAPFNLYDFVRTFFFSRSTSPKRQQYMRTKDDTRADTYHPSKKKL